MGQRTVVVVAGATPASDAALASLPDEIVVVAADSGIDGARRSGLRVDIAVGDFDSVSADGLAAVEASGGRVVRHPEAKDATDLALALDEAAGLLGGGGDVVVLGEPGGRFDHLLAGVLALADPRWSSLRIRAHLGPVTVHVVHGPGEVTIGGAPLGSLLTLVPVGGAVEGVRTGGLRYPLRCEPLAPGSTRGVSNVVDADPATVALAQGTLLVILPGEP